MCLLALKKAKVLTQMKKDANKIGQERSKGNDIVALMQTEEDAKIDLDGS